MGFIGVNQSSDFERTMEVARQYAKLGHSVMIRLQDFWEDSEEHERLEWEVHVDFGYFLCYWWVYPVMQSPYKIYFNGLRG